MEIESGDLCPVVGHKWLVLKMINSRRQMELSNFQVEIGSAKLKF